MIEEIVGRVLKRARRWPASFRSDLEAARQFREFRRLHARMLTAGPIRTAAKGTALFVSFEPHPSVVLLEGVLAKTLDSRGYRPLFVHRRRHTQVLRGQRIFGFDRFIALEDHFPHRHDAEAAGVLETPLEYEALKRLQYHGVMLGPHVLATTSRALHRSRLDFADPRVRAEVIRQRLLSVQTICAAEEIIGRWKPDRLVTIERVYTPYGELFDVALDRGVDTIQFCGAYQDNALMFSRCTSGSKYLHPLSLADSTWAAVQQMEWGAEYEERLFREIESHYDPSAWFGMQQLQCGKKIKAPGDVVRQLGLDSSKKTAVIFAHVLWDIEHYYGEPFYASYEEWLAETARLAAQNLQVNWIIKLHPANMLWPDTAQAGEPPEIGILRRALGTLPAHLKIIPPDTDINTYALFPLTDYCVTVSGTVGIELACYGVPVVTGGRGRYSHRGFTVDSRGREGYEQKLANIQEVPRLTAEQIVLAKRHAYALFLQRPCHLRACGLEMVQNGRPARFVLRASSLEELVGSPEMRAFADWATQARALDFLAPAPEASFIHTG